MHQLKESTRTNTLSLEYNVAGLLCYVPFMFISVVFSVLWLMTEPQSNKLLRFHAMQSLCLSLISILSGGVISILAVVLLPLGGWQLVHGLYSLTAMALLVACILGMINAYTLKMYKLPYIGELIEQHFSQR